MIALHPTILPLLLDKTIEIEYDNVKHSDEPMGIQGKLLFYQIRYGTDEVYLYIQESSVSGLHPTEFSVKDHNIHYVSVFGTIYDRG